MQRTVMSSLLVAAMIAGAVAPAMAEERRPPPSGQEGPRDGGKAGHAGKDRDEHRGGPQMERGQGGNPGLKLAQGLAGLETYIGVTPDQAQAWRAYTDALIAFAEADAPHPGPLSQDAAPAGPPRLMADRLAERAIAKGERAEKLQAAAATLRATLSDAQLARLIGAEAPPKGPHGPGFDADGGPEGNRPFGPPPADAPLQ
ncbi:hypothetical protein [Pseudogemmobacter bohemicus]|uniref:hypothetical protein n=1 Tax=Pseudogemmobacter bohemicus TaxID=2250708 RepID=UPI0013008104|nr:hypothetical protein [Pseudogemmobacter bohemicus]